MHLAIVAILSAALLPAHGAEAAELRANESRSPWVEGAGFRSAPVIPSGRGVGFSSLAQAETGLHFTNLLSERTVAINRVTENGSGVALGDVDGDGWCDIYFCSLEGDNALFKNLGGWRFTNITAQAGIACAGDLSTGAALADTDGDGDLDLLVNSIGGGTRAFLNDGSGRFTEQTGTRLVRRFGSTSMALADIDLDGDLDLYVANYRTIAFDDELPKPKLEARMEGGKIAINPPGRFTAIPAGAGGAEIFEIAERDFLYINNGQGIFTPVSWTNGNFLDERGQNLAAAPADWGLSVMIRDLNDDFLPDIIVCNDFFLSPDQVWLQQPGTRFQLAGRAAFPKFSLASMAADVADIDRDGHDDIFVAEMLGRDLAFRQAHRDNAMKAAFNTQIADPSFRPETPRNSLFLSRGDGTYAEIAELAGLDASEWSWGAQFLDVDLDGYEDLLVPTGHNHDVQEADVLRAIRQTRAPDSIPQRIANLQRLPKLSTPILAFRNTPPLRFVEAQEQWGLNIPGIANGFASADLDNDGDLDLVANRLNSPALLLRNESTAPRAAVRLKGTGANTRGIGAKMIVRGGPVPQQRQTMLAGGRYLSCDDTVRVFAASNANAALSVEVQWPDRTRDLYTNLPANRIYEFSQRGAAGPAPSPVDEPKWFVDRSRALGHRHADSPFDDWQRQPAQPFKLSTQGPALVWTDLNGDGLDDLVAGSGRGGRTEFFHNSGAGFLPVTNAPLRSIASADQAGMLHAGIFGAERSLLAALSNYESASPALPSVLVQTGSNSISLPGDPSSAGAMALADIDGDGDLDLFVGGRALPGRYPEAASSRVFRNTGRELILDAENSAAFAKCGLVASACFADLDNDGWSDLITPLEWGGVRVWRNEHGTLKPQEIAAGMTGLWTGIAAADFDNDGRIDFVAGNWGRNTRHRRFLEKPLRLYHGDFDDNGVYDMLEAVHDPIRKHYAPLMSLELLRQTIPALAERFQSFASYGHASIDSVLNRRPAELLEASTLDSVCFLNRGSAFETRPLPLEAQFAPIFGLAAADFDGDGHEDLAVAQNLFDTHWQAGSLDSGRPLVLRGDGTGSFKTVPFARSGLSGNGQGRSIALADYNRDGRVDIALSQNNDETKLFENHAGTPGLRLRFSGTPQNPHAIGARYRVLDREPGPAREIQCGSGWLAQHSFVHVVRKPSPGARLFVRWGPGRENEFLIPDGARELAVAPTGIVKID